MSGPTLQRGDRVRCFFGAEHRDGQVIDVNQIGGQVISARVRLSPAWVHLADIGDMVRLPRPAVGDWRPEVEPSSEWPFVTSAGAGR